MQIPQHTPLKIIDEVADRSIVAWGKVKEMRKMNGKGAITNLVTFLAEMRESSANLKPVREMERW